MCNNNYLGANFHDALILKRYVDRESDKLFKRLHKKLQEREKVKRAYEKRINECLGHSPMFKSISIPFARISFLGVKRPYVVVEISTDLIGCEPTTGLGIARCWESKDKWDEERGKRIATKKAVRHAARKLAGLE